MVEVGRTEDGKTHVADNLPLRPASFDEHQNGEPQDQRVHVVSNSLEFGNLLVPLVSVVAGLVVDEF